MKLLKYLSLALGFVACSTETPPIEESPAQKIVNQSIKAHGYDGLDDFDIDFVFRDKAYSYHQHLGDFEYTRTAEADGNTIKDVMNNDTTYRMVNDEMIAEPDSQLQKYRSSINSVIYFAFLPYRLNDEAAHKKYLGEVNILGKTYHKIQVTFAEEGGGEDHDDVFLYWFDKETLLLDYLAYTYEVNGGGIRFRQAIDRKTLPSGLVVQNYINSKPHSYDIDFQMIDQLFEKGELKELSRIELEF